MTVTTASGEKPQEDQMKAAFENEFFHLMFSQYAQVSERNVPTKIPQLLETIGGARDFEAFRRELTRHPIEEENHRDFVASLKERMDAIERLRNCVAHNRTITRRIRENYDKARNELKERMEEFLDSFSEADGDPEQKPRRSQ